MRSLYPCGPAGFILLSAIVSVIIKEPLLVYTLLKIIIAKKNITAKKNVITKKRKGVQICYWQTKDMNKPYQCGEHVHIV